MHPRILSSIFFILGAFGTFIFFASQNVVPARIAVTPVAVARGAVLGEQTANAFNDQLSLSKISPSKLTFQIHDTVYVRLEGQGFEKGLKIFVGPYEIHNQVKSDSLAILELPMNRMNEGQYDIRVVTSGDAFGFLANGLSISKKGAASSSAHFAAPTQHSIQAGETAVQLITNSVANEPVSLGEKTQILAVQDEVQARTKNVKIVSIKY